MEKKQYNTRGKTQLLRYLSEQMGEAKTVEQICLGLAEDGEAPGRSSVYRMLSTLSRAGEVKRHRLPAPATGYAYEYIGDAHRCTEHFHLHCVGCGSVTHLECGCGEQIAEHLRSLHGFCVDRGRSVFYGVCADCIKRGQTV